jgi:hypothetical protein
MCKTKVQLIFAVCFATFLFAVKIFAAPALESVRMGPMPFNVATGLSVEVESDAEVDFEYRWFVNGEEKYFNKSAHLPGDAFVRRDNIRVEVTPVGFGGERYPSIVSKEVEASNAPPVITSEPPQQFRDSKFSYQVSAQDPDGDELTYSLEGDPEKMQINAKAGLITWDVDDMPDTGDYAVKVIVEDPFEGKAEQKFEVQTSSEVIGK